MGRDLGKWWVCLEVAIQVWRGWFEWWKLHTAGKTGSRNT